EINFNFGMASPLTEQTDPYLFSMRWEGSLLAPDTGEYEIVLRTEQGARLWLNDMTKPLIDAGIKSGSDTEFRSSLFMLGGRIYPIRLEFFKGIQGVNNAEKLKQKPLENASIA